MKTLTTLLIASATAISLNVNANSFLNETADEEIGYMIYTNSQTVTPGSSANILSEVAFLNETVEDEYRYMDSNSNQNIAGVLRALDNNPPAAGGRSSSHLNQVSFLNETADEEYQQ